MHELENKTKKPDNKSRKTLLAIIIIAAALLVAAIGFFVSRPTCVEVPLQMYSEQIEYNSGEASQPINGDETPESCDYIIPKDSEETPQERSERIERERREFAESIIREQVLEDFDYMMAVFEDNFPFFDLTYRRHGSDIREEARRFRGVLADESMPIDAKIFEELLLFDFMSSIHWVGHVRTVDDFMYHMYMYRVANHTETAWTAALHEEIFTAHPSTSMFYGEIGEYELRNAARRHVASGHGPNSYTMRIIEEGNIALIHVNSLFSASYRDRENLNDFYEQIADFNHLIIDLRGNPGGYHDVFHELITTPLISESVYLDVVSFYKGGEHNLRMMEIRFDSGFQISEAPAQRPSHFSGETFAINENILGRDGEPLFWGTQYLAWEDIDAFDYYVVGAMKSVHPSGPDDIQSNFSGQVWLLTSDTSFSGSEHVVALYKQNDLAIIVGEQGAGVFMCLLLWSNYFALPNTGIIIRYDVGYPVCRLTGRPLEEGIPPHFHNRPGMDALETTLELIAEGVYRD